MPILAPTIDETGVGGGPNAAKTLGELTRFTQWVNYLGVPALNAPCGFDTRGLPIGLQLVARPFNEQALLQIADTFQRATDWHGHAPALKSS
jgi:aspartyl-tRNA(Asn)/glutamyl-tRNA(Gln) amidotransferase subunit A